MNRIARTAHCVITSDGWKTVVTFPDGRTCDAIPHMTPHYYVIAHRCGYGDDIASYCFEHEVAHAVVSEWLWDRPSPVLDTLASGAMLTGKEAVAEELLAQTLQRFVRAGERPIIGGVKWDKLRAAFLAAMEDGA